MKQVLKIASRIATDTRSDRDLLVSFAATRDAGAMAELFRRHADAVRRVAADVCPSATDEVVQAAFLLLTERAGTLTDRVSAAGWLFQVARRLALKARTASARRSRHEALAPSTEPLTNPLDDLAFREVRALVAEELARLPERLRVVLVLHYWEGAAHADAAVRLGCSVSTLKRRLEDGRERLGARLARRGLTGASVLAVLTTLQAQAATRLPPTAGPSTSPRAAELLRSASGAGIAKAIGVTACVLVAGIGLAFGLVTRPEPVPIRAGANPQPPASRAVPAPDAPRTGLPAGAIAQLGSNGLHHGGIIERVFISPDGRYAVSVGSHAIMSVWNVKTKLWDLETEKELPLAKGKLPEVPGGTHVVTAVTVGKSLALLVAPVDPDKARGAGPWLIDALSGETLADLPKKSAAEKIAIHPSGKAVAIAGATAPEKLHEIHLHDLEKKKPPIALLEPQRHQIKHFRFSPDGRHLAIQFCDGVRIDIVDAQTGKVAFSAPDTDVTGGPYDRFAFSPDGKLFAKEDRGNKTLRVWAVADGKEQPRIPCEDGNWGNALVFDATGTRLGHLSARGAFRLFDLATGKPVWEARCRGGFLGGFDAAFTPDGNRLVTTEHEDVIVRDSKNGKIFDATVHKADIFHVTWARDSKQVVTWDRDSGTPGRMWDATTGRALATIAGHATGCGALTASPDGALIATAGSRVRKNEGDTSVRLWSAADGGEIARFNPKLAGSESGVRHLWFTSDGKTLVGVAREIGYVWDVATKRELRSFAHPFASVSSAHPLAGDRVLLSGWLPRADGTPNNVTDDPLNILVLDLTTGKEVGSRVEFGRDGLRGASADGRFAIRTSYGSSSDHRAEIWDLTTGRALGRISGSDGKGESPWVSTGSFSPDQRTFAVGYSDGTVRVYEWATRTERLRFAHGASIQNLAYSPDGTRLASSGSRWGLIWDLTTPQAAKPASDADAWTGLAGTDGRAGLAAVRYWTERPADAVQYLKKRVQPVAAVDPKQVAGWIEQLESADFATREVATKRLAEVGDGARKQLADAAKSDSPETRNRLTAILAAVGDDKPLSGELLRAIRAVEILEAVRTPSAREVLKALAGGAPGTRLTREPEPCDHDFPSA